MEATENTVATTSEEASDAAPGTPTTGSAPEVISFDAIFGIDAVVKMGRRRLEANQLNGAALPPKMPPDGIIASVEVRDEILL